MKQEQRIVCFDETLGISAYRFIGVMQKFPNHFHEYYVLGLLRTGIDICPVKTKSIPSAEAISFYLTQWKITLVLR